MIAVDRNEAVPLLLHIHDTATEKKYCTENIFIVNSIVYAVYLIFPITE